MILANWNCFYEKVNIGFTHYSAFFKTIFPEILRLILVPVWLLAPVWRFLVGATHAKISGNNPDPEIASSFVKGADMHLDNFLDDLKVYASLNGD